MEKSLDEQIDTLNQKLGQMQKAHRDAERQANEISQRRIELLSQGQSTKEIYKKYDSAISLRDRLAKEIELFENQTLFQKQQERISNQPQNKPPEKPKPHGNTMGSVRHSARYKRETPPD